MVRSDLAASGVMFSLAKPLWKRLDPETEFRNAASICAAYGLDENVVQGAVNPDEALGLSAIPCDGVGLARLEFIIANQIKVHPLALLNFDLLTDSDFH